MGAFLTLALVILTSTRIIDGTPLAGSSFRQSESSLPNDSPLVTNVSFPQLSLLANQTVMDSLEDYEYVYTNGSSGMRDDEYSICVSTMWMKVEMIEWKGDIAPQEIDCLANPFIIGTLELHKEKPAILVEQWLVLMKKKHHATGPFSFRFLVKEKSTGHIVISASFRERRYHTAIPTAGNYFIGGKSLDI